MKQTGLGEPAGQQEYKSLKEELGQKLDETSENFVVVGYILKQMRDRCLYMHENFKDIYDFGLRVYGLSKATVSRFMNINTKFSIGGNSREIKPEYRGYGRSKIQEMLNVDDCDMGLVVAETTVDQVKELKKVEREQGRLEEKEREDSLPLVQLLAPGETGNRPVQEQGDPFGTLLAAFWEENMDLYRSVAAGLASPETIAEEISPAGSRTFRNGINIMFFYEFDRGAKLRSYEKGKAAITAYTYREIMEKTRELVLGEPAAVPPADPEVQEAPYMPVPGQTTVEDFGDVVPEGDAEPDASPDAGRDDAAAGGNVIDAEYREVSTEPAAEGACIYTDTEIRDAMGYFDIGYPGRTGVQQDAAKCRNYRIALECIRRCYPSIAGRTDNGQERGT